MVYPVGFVLACVHMVQFVNTDGVNVVCDALEVASDDEVHPSTSSTQLICLLSTVLHICTVYWSMT